MKPIIQPIAVEILEKELTPDIFVRKTNFENNEVYVFTAKQCPNLMLEVGRVREWAFRLAGGGSGDEVDIDRYDTSEKPFHQLIVWDPKDKVILGGYRFLFGRDAELDAHGEPVTATSHLFKFSETFKEEYLPFTIELGRSFVTPDYQTGKMNRKSIFALDNLWDGIAAIVVDNPDAKYLFGKVTMYTNYNKKARDLVLYFLKHFCPDPQALARPYHPILIDTPEEELAKWFVGKNFEENQKILSQKVRELGENIPPMINSYMNVSPSMHSFGTAISDEFGDVEETGILVTIADIYPSKSKRHIATYHKYQGVE